MINRILHSLSFHMEFMKLAEGSFHKFHIKMTTRVRSFILEMYNTKKVSEFHIIKFKSIFLQIFMHV